MGKYSQHTEHPYIMKANEEFLHWNELLDIIKPLDIACSDYDEASVAMILKNAPTGFDSKKNNHIPANKTFEYVS